MAEIITAVLCLLGIIYIGYKERWKPESVKDHMTRKAIK